jgi:hypothetical protein
MAADNRILINEILNYKKTVIINNFIISIKFKLKEHPGNSGVFHLYFLNFSYI